MSTDETRWDKATELFISQTKSGAIEWAAAPEAKPKCKVGDGVAGVPYTATIKGRRFLVYEYEYKMWPSEDSFYEATEVSIEIVNDDFDMEYRLPRPDGRWQLLGAIREQTSGANDFLDDFLNERGG